MVVIVSGILKNDFCLACNIEWISLMKLENRLVIILNVFVVFVSEEIVVTGFSSFLRNLTIACVCQYFFMLKVTFILKKTKWL